MPRKETIYLPRGVSKPVNSRVDIDAELPRVLRELLAVNDQRRQRDPDKLHYWNGYGLALKDIWSVFKHLYDYE